MKFSKFDQRSNSKKRAQTAIEYLLLIAATIVVILVAFLLYIPEVRLKSERVFNITTNQIMGPPAQARAGATNYP